MTLFFFCFRLCVWFKTIQNKVHDNKGIWICYYFRLLCSPLHIGHVCLWVYEWNLMRALYRYICDCFDWAKLINKTWFTHWHILLIIFYPSCAHFFLFLWRVELKQRETQFCFVQPFNFEYTFKLNTWTCII